MNEIGGVILEPSIGDVVYQYMGNGIFDMVEILGGQFLDSKYKRLSNFWKWKNLKTEKIEEGYGDFYEIKR